MNLMNCVNKKEQIISKIIFRTFVLILIGIYPLIISIPPGTSAVPISDEFSVLKVGSSREAAIQKTSEVLESILGSSLNTETVSNLNSFIRTVEEITTPELVIIGHGTKYGLQFYDNLEISWYGISNVLQRADINSKVHFLACYSSNIRQYYPSSKLGLTFEELIGVEAAAFSVAKSIIINHMLRYKGFSESLSITGERYDPYIQKLESLARILTDNPFPSGLTLSQHTTARTRITAAVMIDENPKWTLWDPYLPPPYWYDHSDIIEDIEEWSSELDETFGIDVTVEFVEKFQLEQNQAGTSYTIKGTNYTATDNLHAAMLQAMQAFPGEWDPINAVNDYDILIVYVYGWNGGKQQAWGVGYGNAVVCAFTHPWFQSVKLCHEISHLYGASHPDPGPYGLETEPKDSWYDEFPDYAQSASIMSYAHATTWFTALQQPITWDSHNYEKMYFHTRDQFADTDPDGDGITNEWEYILGYYSYDNDSDNDWFEDGKHPWNNDFDNDCLSDYDELVIHGTLPNNPDTDGDGLSDYDEVNILNTDPKVFNHGDGTIEASSDVQYTEGYEGGYYQVVDVTTRMDFEITAPGTCNIRISYRFKGYGESTPGDWNPILNTTERFFVGPYSYTKSIDFEHYSIIEVKWEIYDANGANLLSSNISTPLVLPQPGATIDQSETCHWNDNDVIRSDCVFDVVNGGPYIIVGEYRRRGYCQGDLAWTSWQSFGTWETPKSEVDNPQGIHSQAVYNYNAWDDYEIRWTIKEGARGNVLDNYTMTYYGANASPEDHGYVKSSSTLSWDAYEVFYSMKFHIYLHGTYYIKVQYKISGSWTTAFWGSAYYGTGDKTKFGTLFSPPPSYSCWIDVKFFLYFADGSTEVDSHITSVYYYGGGPF